MGDEEKKAQLKELGYEHFKPNIGDICCNVCVVDNSTKPCVSVSDLKAYCITDLSIRKIEPKIKPKNKVVEYEGKFYSYVETAKDERKDCTKCVLYMCGEDKIFIKLENLGLPKCDSYCIYIEVPAPEKEKPKRPINIRTLSSVSFDVRKHSAEFKYNLIHKLDDLGYDISKISAGSPTHISSDVYFIGINFNGVCYVCRETSQSILDPQILFPGDITPKPKGIKEFVTGKYYRYIGPKPGQAGFNDHYIGSPLSVKVYEGRVYECLEGRKGYSKFCKEESEFIWPLELFEEVLKLEPKKKKPGPPDNVEWVEGNWINPCTPKFPDGGMVPPTRFSSSSLNTQQIPNPEVPDQIECEACDGTGDACENCEGNCYEGTNRICHLAGEEEQDCEECGGTGYIESPEDKLNFKRTKFKMDFKESDEVSLTPKNKITPMHFKDASKDY